VHRVQLCKLLDRSGNCRVGLVEAGAVRLMRGPQQLAEILQFPDTARLARSLLEPQAQPIPLSDAVLLPPVDAQEVWAAGVTYVRSKAARERESQGAARFYDLVYTAPRPELFFKSTASRVVGPGRPIRVRRDSRWTVPEPELAVVVAPDRRIVGFTIGNDMSARDIEGENPLYLPQAKVYDGSCALGPVVTLAGFLPPADQTTIRLTIRRGATTAFDGATTLAAMARPLDELLAWLGREKSFPDGVILLTGTGVVPPDDFALQNGDEVAIEISGIGRLCNPVA
jgi:2-dehydro-3-deoxy-D-arabinonate dehydratase